MKMEVINQVDLNYDRTLNTVNFFAKNVLGKYPKQNKWKVKVWLHEKGGKTNLTFTCGIELFRPRKGTIYAKKESGSLNEAVKKSFNTVEKSVKKDGLEWFKKNLYQEVS
jgi:hypothetical protein